MKPTRSLALVAAAILGASALDWEGRVYGYSLSRRSGVRSGLLYPKLCRMVSEGWLQDHWETPVESWGRPSRRYYTVTDEGRVQLGDVVRRYVHGLGGEVTQR